MRALALLLALAAAACAGPPAPLPPAETVRLDTEADCRNATPGNRLPFFRCTGDFDSFD